MMQIDEGTSLDTILEAYPDAIHILARHGLYCLSCPAEIFVSLGDAAESRGIPIDHLIEALREFSADSESK